jgi:hypothetical protein
MAQVLGGAGRANARSTKEIILNGNAALLSSNPLLDDHCFCTCGNSGNALVLSKPETARGVCTRIDLDELLASSFDKELEGMPELHRRTPQDYPF